MLFKRKKQEVPELNTVSTADISFMLLIFFLVTTSMNLDKGLRGRIPPKEKKEKQEQTEVNKTSFMSIELLPNNQMTLEGKPIGLDSISSVASRFILKHAKKHVIYIHSHPESNYNSYFKLQNALALAYQKARNELCLKRYNCEFELADAGEREAIAHDLPQRIVENAYENDKGGEQ
ncbi:ExbD/TolR family protein [Hoylesella nanceiensis]